MVPRCDNRLLVSGLNILTSLLSYSPLAMTALELRAWDIIMERTHELVLDLSCLSDEADNCSQISDLTVENLETVNPIKILARLAEVIAFMSSASEEVATIILSGKIKKSIPSSIPDCPSHSGDCAVKELLFCTDTVLCNCRGRVDISIGINVLSAMHNMSLDATFPAALDKYDGTARLMKLLQTYAPGAIIPKTTSTDRLDIATLVLSIFRNVTNQQDADTCKYLVSLLDANLVSVMGTYSELSESLTSPDFAIALTQVVVLLRENCAARLTKDAAGVIAATLANILRSSVCLEPTGLQLSLKVVMLLRSICTEWDLEINGPLVTALMTFRSASTNASDPTLKDALDQVFVVADTCEVVGE